MKKRDNHNVGNSGWGGTGAISQTLLFHKEMNAMPAQSTEQHHFPASRHGSCGLCSDGC